MVISWDISKDFRVYNQLTLINPFPREPIKYPRVTVVSNKHMEKYEKYRKNWK